MYFLKQKSIDKNNTCKEKELSYARMLFLRQKSKDQLSNLAWPKEKDVAEARLEVIQAEADRLNKQSDYLKKQADDAVQSLNEERQKSQVGGQECD